MTNLFEKHKESLTKAVSALHTRDYFTLYPEHPKAYGEDTGAAKFPAMMNEDFKELLQENPAAWKGEEVSPYLQTGLGIQYPTFEVEDLIARSNVAYSQWKKISVEDRAGLLIECLEAVKTRFFEIAYATMHTTGQSFMMSFQASGPHGNDRALEAIAVGYEELTQYPKEAQWVKNMGKFDVTLKKNWKPVSRGIGLVIGCSTFPTWNTVPGVFADLITGNSVIVKPHPKSVLPIAIVIAEMQKVFKINGINPEVVQLAVDGNDNLITKELAEHKEVKLIDYTGSSAFGEYLEGLTDKIVFTEKAGVNSLILDSVNDMTPVVQNIAFSLALYSGQMCTAPQNVYVPETGVKTPTGTLSYEAVVTELANAISGLVEHPKMGYATLGGIQNDATLRRAKEVVNLGGKAVLQATPVENPEFTDARTISPALIEVNAAEADVYGRECFGPVMFVVKTKNTDESIALAKASATKHGAITCAAYTTDNITMARIEDEMNEAFTPVSFNLTGAIFVNQHAAFSDLHVTGGNPSGNATFADHNYINRRFVWVGNRFA